MGSIKAKLFKIQPDPKHQGRQLVTLKLTDEDGEYQKTFSIITPENPLSLEQLATNLGTQDLSRPIDTLQNIKDAAAHEQEFTIPIMQPVPPKDE